MSDIAAEVQKWKTLIEALGYRCLTGTDEGATVLTIMRGEQVVGSASLHSDGELSHYVDAAKIADALSTAREEGRLEGLEEAARWAEGWPTEEAGDQYQTCGNGRFWDAGTNYDQGRIDAAAAIRALKEKQP